MTALRPVSDCKPRSTEQFADLANLFAGQPVRPDFDGCPALNRESGLDQGSAGLRGEPNPYPLRT